MDFTPSAPQRADSWSDEGLLSGPPPVPPRGTTDPPTPPQRHLRALDPDVPDDPPHEPATAADTTDTATAPDGIEAAGIETDDTGTTGTDGRRSSARRAGRAVRDGITRRLPPRRGGTRPHAESPPEIGRLLTAHRAAHPRADLRLIQRAYEVAERMHSGQLRRSGEEYITHPLAVAAMLAEFGMDTTTLVAALLHDTVEDTGYTLDEVRADFGGEVAHLVDGVTKLDKVTFGAAAEAETIRKLIVAMARDSRVLVIKLADRLHNMRTLRFQPRHKQERIARMTLDVLVPLASRLGLDAIRRELEDLAFSTLSPEAYEQTVALVEAHDPASHPELAAVVARIQDDLADARIHGSVAWRPRHYSSVHEKVVERSAERMGVFDLVRVLVQVDSVRECYTALGIVHALWQPVPARLQDLIATPKFNMYQSLHTTVIGSAGAPVDVQIRTRAMHQVAEYGVAARFRGRAARDIEGRYAAAGGTDELAWLRRLLDWQRETSDPGEFLESLSTDLGEDEVMVFTPKGDVVALPAGATPVDLAYSVHTDVGHRCIGARVNGRLVPLQSTVSDGDVVEVFTSRSDSAGPSEDWLAFVTSPRARIEIRRRISRQRRHEAVEAGRESVRRAARARGLSTDQPDRGELTQVAETLRCSGPDEMFAAVHAGRIEATAVLAALPATLTGTTAGGRPEPAAGGQQDAVGAGRAPAAGTTRRPFRHPAVVVDCADGTSVRLARCCTPVPGDEALGSVTRAGGVTVHRRDCHNLTAPAAHSARVIPVTWVNAPGARFLVAIKVEALDRHGLLADTTQVLSDQQATILSATTTTTAEKTAVEEFTVELDDPGALPRVLRAVREIQGVYDAYRVASRA